MTKEEMLKEMSTELEIDLTEHLKQPAEKVENFYNYYKRTKEKGIVAKKSKFQSMVLAMLLM